ncbi:hypothetical protein FXW78_46570 [Rhodococcus opacus]|nr:hypothetical protein [Rhodococcus opacus]
MRAAATCTAAAESSTEIRTSSLCCRSTIHSTLGTILRTLESSIIEEGSSGMDSSPELDPPMVPESHARRIPVSSGQEDLWFAQQLAPGLPNNIAAYLDIAGVIDPVRMDAALRRVLGEARTILVNFVEDEDGRPRQVLQDPDRWNPLFFDLSDDIDPQSAAQALMADVVRQPFDLERDALCRGGLIRLGESRFYLFTVCPHIVTDAFGGVILARRTADVYAALQSGKTVPESGFGGPELMNSEDARYRCSDRFTRDREFWQDYTAALPPPLHLPGHPGSPVPVTLHQSVVVTRDEAAGGRRRRNRWGCRCRASWPRRRRVGFIASAGCRRSLCAWPWQIEWELSDAHRVWCRTRFHCV